MSWTIRHQIRHSDSLLNSPRVLWMEEILIAEGCKGAVLISSILPTGTGGRQTIVWGSSALKRLWNTPRAMKISMNPAAGCHIESQWELIWVCSCPPETYKLGKRWSGRGVFHDLWPLTPSFKRFIHYPPLPVFRCHPLSSRSPWWLNQILMFSLLASWILNNTPTH